MQPHPAYEIFEEIGRGEGTVVFRAHDLNLGREVAIKQLDEAGRADPKRRERFLKEARFLAQSAHPGILQVHTVEPERGWIVMELMDGTLAGQIHHASMPADTVRSVLTQLLPALSFLHSRGKIHGAIRPSNILIDHSGSVRLSDFEETSTSGELRAPAAGRKYLAPELIRPEFGPLGPQSDLYCLAFSAVELLAGDKFDKLTIQADGAVVNPDVAWLRWHTGDQPLPAVQSLIPGLPKDLCAALDSMLIKQVENRCSSAESALQLLADQPAIAVEAVPDSLKEVGSDAGTAADHGMLPAHLRELESPMDRRSSSLAGSKTPERVTGRAGGRAAGTQGKKGSNTPSAKNTKEGTRDQLNEILSKPYVLYPLCASILLVALGVGFFLRTDTGPIDPNKEIAMWDVEKAGPNPTEQEAVQTELGAEETGENEQQQIVPSASEKDGETTEPAAQTSSNLLVEETDLVELTETEEEADLVDLGSQPKTERESELQNIQEAIVDLTEEAEANALASLEPKEESIEVLDGKNTVEESESVQRLLARMTSPLIGLVSVELDTKQLLQEFKGDAELIIDSGGFMSEVTDVAFSPDGSWVAASGEKVVRIWEVETGNLLHTLRGDRSRAAYGNCHAVAFSPDGKFLLVGVNDYQPHGSIRVYRTDNLQEIDSLLPGHDSPVRRLSFSRDGRYLASADANGMIALWDWSSRKILNTANARNTESPILDELIFPSEDPVLLGIDFDGPLLLGVPKLNTLSARDPLPPLMFGWMVDILGKKLKYPFGADKQPRIFDLALDSGIWAAAGLGSVEGANRFWVGIWPGRDQDAAAEAEPKIVYTAHRWSITSVALSPSRHLAASGDSFGEVHLWDSRTGKTLQRLRAQGRPNYRAAFERDSNRIAYGSTAHSKDRWGINNYGSAEKVLDLAERAVYPAQTMGDLNLLQERTASGNVSLRSAVNPNDPSSQMLQKMVDGRLASEYELTSGRMVTVYTLLNQAVLGVNTPVILGDNIGLLAVWNSDTDELKRAYLGHQGMVSSVSVSQDGKRILSASADRTLRLWSLEDYQPTGIFDFKFENSVVTKVLSGTDSSAAGVRVGDRILTIDGLSLTDMQNRMLEGTFDYEPGQSVPIQMQRDGETYNFQMRLREGYDFSEPLLTVYLGDDDSWIVWTPSGYYDASPGADRLIGWHINRGPDKSAAYFEVQQFRKQLYRPDIINRILAGASVSEAVAAANVDRPEDSSLDFRSPSDVAAHHPPAIEFVSPTSGQELTSATANLRAIVSSKNGLPITEVTLLVNDNAIAVLTPPTPTTTKFEIEYPLELISGRNYIELIAANSESTSGARAINVMVEQTAPTRIPDLRVLAIGISEVASASKEFERLPTASNDARKFESILKAQESSDLYNQVATRTLCDAQASREAIIDGLQWLVDETQPGDTVAIYIAAHGFIDSSQNFYIGTYDVDVDRPRASAVSWREFIKTLHLDLPSSKRLVFLDLTPTPEAVNPDLRNPLLDLAAPELATNFFSSNSLQQSQLPQPSGSNGFLTKALVQMLQDPQADTMPEPLDAKLNTIEVASAWSRWLKQLSDQQLYPVAYTPNSHRPKNILQLEASP